ncbi:MAG: efflux RND transporter periplasmic adaptor subunit [Balneolaceae bacterium]|nr:MAG: efflux RND transporter periplasmic adaptor subunit [Balneolaceae bacterium]
MKTLKNSLFIIFIALFSVACGGGNGNQASGPGFGGFGGGQPASVEVTAVQAGTISEQVRAYGTIRAQDVVSVTPQVSNRITRILVDLGDNVTRGQVMAEIYDASFRDAVEQAQAQIRQARATFERDSTQLARNTELFERDLISRSEFDDVRTSYLNSLAQYESARAALTQSRENLENTRITSPVDGVVLNRMIAEGDVATTGQPVFEVANLVGFETRVFLPLRDWEAVQVGQAVSMALSSRGSEIATGIVSRKSPQLNANTGLGEIVISLTEAASSVFQGALVQAQINLQTRENVVIIPRSAMIERVDTYIEPETGTIELERSYTAFVSQGDTTAVQRQLVLGIEQGDRIEVIEGLQPGDGLIITGHRNLEDGSRIRVAGSERAGNPSSDGERAEQLRNLTPEQIEQMRQERQQQGGGQGRGQGRQASGSN